MLYQFVDIFETVSSAVRGWTPRVTSKQHVFSFGLKIFEIASINYQFLKFEIQSFSLQKLLALMKH